MQCFFFSPVYDGLIDVYEVLVLCIVQPYMFVLILAQQFPLYAVHALKKHDHKPGHSIEKGEAITNLKVQ